MKSIQWTTDHRVTDTLITSMILNHKDKQQREAIEVGNVSTASMTIYSQWAIDLKTVCKKKLYNAYIISCYTVYLVKCSLTNSVAVDKQLLLILFHNTKQHNLDQVTPSAGIWNVTVPYKQ